MYRSTSTLLRVALDWRYLLVPSESRGKLEIPTGKSTDSRVRLEVPTGKPHRGGR